MKFVPALFFTGVGVALFEIRIAHPAISKANLLLARIAGFFRQPSHSICVVFIGLLNWAQALAHIRMITSFIMRITEIKDVL